MVRKIRWTVMGRFLTQREHLRRELKKQVRSGRVTIGRFTYGLPQVYDWNESAHINIGSFCSIAESVVIFAGGEHHTEWTSTYPFEAVSAFNETAINEFRHVKSKGDVWIGNDVWIGHGATIMSGVCIGHGAVIGARAVVTRDVKPFEIVGGVPARSIGFRFPEDTQRQLLACPWWDLDLDTIQDLVPLLTQAPELGAIQKLQDIYGSSS